VADHNLDVNLNHLNKIPSIPWQELKDSDRPADSQFVPSDELAVRPRRAGIPRAFSRAIGDLSSSDEEDDEDVDNDDEEGYYTPEPEALAQNDKLAHMQKQGMEESATHEPVKSPIVEDESAPNEMDFYIDDSSPTNVDQQVDSSVRFE
jgi:hypothetical protein